MPSLKSFASVDRFQLEPDRTGGPPRVRRRLTVLGPLEIEAGQPVGGDPFDRVTYPWPDAGGKPDNALLKDYKRLIAMRNAHPVLRHGSIDAPAYIDEHVIALIRHDGKQWAITATNNASDAREVTFDLPRELANASFDDALSNQRVKAGASTITLSVPPMGGFVLLKRRTDA